MNYYGALIQRERAERGWSQQALCQNICTVSYLSKIETGKSAPSDEILRLLLERLGLESSPQLEAESRALAERCYEALFCGSDTLPKPSEIARQQERFRATPFWLDLELIRRHLAEEGALDSSLETSMDTRQLAMQRVLQKRPLDAARVYPNAFFHYLSGCAACHAGHYSDAIHQLQLGYELAARDGAAEMMLSCAVLLGDCASHRNDLEQMHEYYRISGRLAVSLGKQDLLETMRCNIAAARMQQGQFRDAYEHLTQVEHPTILALLQLAICCEKLEKAEEAFHALKAAEPNTPQPLKAPFALVRYRLEHPDYLSHDAYGELLGTTFRLCRMLLPAGYTQFHLPWMIEWLSARRQYKEICRLIAEFPEASVLNKSYLPK